MSNCTQRALLSLPALRVQIPQVQALNEFLAGRAPIPDDQFRVFCIPHEEAKKIMNWIVNNSFTTSNMNLNEFEDCFCFGEMLIRAYAVKHLLSR